MIISISTQDQLTYTMDLLKYYMSIWCTKHKCHVHRRDCLPTKSNKLKKIINPFSENDFREKMTTDCVLFAEYPYCAFKNHYATRHFQETNMRFNKIFRSDISKKRKNAHTRAIITRPYLSRAQRGTPYLLFIFVVHLPSRTNAAIHTYTWAYDFFVSTKKKKTGVNNNDGAAIPQPSERRNFIRLHHNMIFDCINIKIYIRLY